MKKIVTTLIFLGSLGASAQAISKLYQDFLDRDQLKLGPSEGAAINFLKLMKFNVENIVELEIVDSTGSFVLRTDRDIVCLGSPDAKLLRCKNKIGLTTVSYQGDAD